MTSAAAHLSTFSMEFLVAVSLLLVIRWVRLLVRGPGTVAFVRLVPLVVIPSSSSSTDIAVVVSTTSGKALLHIVVKSSA